MFVLADVIIQIISEFIINIGTQRPYWTVACIRLLGASSSLRRTGFDVRSVHVGLLNIVALGLLIICVFPFSF